MKEYEYFKRNNYSKIGDSYDDIPSYKDLNYTYRNVSSYLQVEEVEEKENFLLQKIESLKTKIALSGIKKIIINEMKKDYYKDITNLSEVVDIDTHLMNNFICGIDHMHVENLVIWQNGFYNFNCFNFPIPASVRKKVWDCSDCGAIIPKKLSRYYEKNELICK